MGQGAIGKDAGPISPANLAAGACLAAIVILGFFVIPSHTYLHSDSQVYVPILERIWNPELYAADPVATRPHVAFSVYDETAAALRWITGQSFRTVLTAEQVVFRFVALLGVFLIGRAASLSVRMSILLASLYSLGMFLTGPSILTVEYEPVPRGFSLPFLLLAIGLAAHGRWTWTGIAAGIAVLYHPPTAFPFLLVLGILAVLPHPDRQRRIAGFVPIGAGIAIALILSRFQAGLTEPQPVFSTIELEIEKLQQLRSSYNWIELWGAQWIRQYEMLWLISLAALVRIRQHLAPTLRFLLLGTSLYGLLSIPLSYVLLDVAKWALMPAFQPARATLFIVLAAIIGCAAAGAHAARAGRFWEAWLWFCVPFALPFDNEVIQILLPDLRDPFFRTRAAVMLILAILATAAARLEWRRSRASWLAWAAALLLPFYLYTAVAKVNLSVQLDHPEMHTLADWAREHTPTDTIFLFPDAGKQLYPGLFRATALRTVYVDWKSGGQVNLFPGFARDWWKRWQESMEGDFDPAKLDRYANLEIDYLVLRSENRLPNREPVYQNERYLVYPNGASR